MALMAIGEELRRVREEMGLSQRAFAEKFEINLRSLSRYENGQAAPRGVTLRHLEKILAEAKRLLGSEDRESSLASQPTEQPAPEPAAETEADLLLQELGAWVRRTVMRRPDALEQISAGVRRLINEVEGVVGAPGDKTEQNKASPTETRWGTAGEGG